jgi:hypothetical protein
MVLPLNGDRPAPPDQTKLCSQKKQPGSKQPGGGRAVLDELRAARRHRRLDNQVRKIAINARTVAAVVAKNRS